MPDLSDLPTLFSVRWLVLSVLPKSDDGKKSARALRFVFTRIVDRAIREYEIARAILVKLENETKDGEPRRLTSDGPGGLPEALMFTDHFEACVLSIARLLKLLRAVSGDEHLGKFVPKESRKLLEAHRKKMIDARNSIEHIDERIHDDEASSIGQVIMGFDWGGKFAHILSHKVSLSETALILRRLHGIAVELIPTMPTAESNAAK
jgi:hypothetical protein